MKTRYALMFLVLAAVSQVIQAQSLAWPLKPVRTIVPMLPGGNADIVARMITAKLSEELGQQFIVDNRAGAGGSIGASILAHANPDGYTIIIMSSSYAANAALYTLPYDPIKDIAPISLISVVPFILAVHPSVKAGTLKEFVELTRGKPRSLNFGSPGTGSAPHLTAVLFQQMAKIEMVHIPYKGDGAAIIDLIGGQIQATFATGVVLTPHMTAGKLRGLAVTTEQRSPANPDLPPINEVVPGYSVAGWTGVLAPAGMPKEIVIHLNRALARILKLSEVQERLRAGGAEPTYTTSEEFRRLIVQDISKWSHVVKSADIKVD